MASKSHVFYAPLARRLPDPVFQATHGTERHMMFVPVRRIPKGLSLGPNARTPNLNRRVYKDVDRSLRDIDTIAGSFHLKHKGITLIAESVEKTGKEEYTVFFEDKKNHGIVDGGHTYELITSANQAELPKDQYVKFEILVGVLLLPCLMVYLLGAPSLMELTGPPPGPAPTRAPDGAARAGARGRAGPSRVPSLAEDSDDGDRPLGR